MSGPRAVTRRLRAALGLLGALAAAGCAYSMVAGGALRPQALADLSARTAAARGIAAPGPVPARVIERDDLPGILRDMLAPQWTSAEIADYEAGLVTVGVWPAARDLLEEFVRLSRDQLAGLYVPPEGVLYVVADAERPLSFRMLSSLARRDLYLELVLSHEIVHWLQDRAYPWLLEEDFTWKHQDDYARAVQTAVEGDAMHYGLVAWLGGSERLPSPDDFAERAAEEPPVDAPALLRLTLLLPYVSGYRLSVAEGRHLLDAPPASTEQAIHPERRREPFTVSDLDAARRALPGGCRVFAANTLGEVGISVLFRDLAADPEPAAWEGWDGDRYLAARCGDRRELVWWTSWDDAAEAREFADAYRQIAEAARARAGLAAPLVPWRDGATVVVATPAFGDPAAWAGSLRTDRVATGPQLRRFFGAPYVHAGAPAP